MSVINVYTSCYRHLVAGRQIRSDIAFVYVCKHEPLVCFGRSLLIKFSKSDLLC